MWTYMHCIEVAENRKSLYFCGDYDENSGFRTADGQVLVWGLNFMTYSGVSLTFTVIKL